MGWVQSWITNVGFSETLKSFKQMEETNLGVLLKPESRTPDEFDWIVSERIRKGDILFFYHTKSAQRNIAKLIAEHQESYRLSNRIIRFLRRSGHKKTRQLLDETAKQSGEHSGRIFACAEVSGPAKRIDDRFYAFLGKVEVFKQPLAADRFMEFAKVGEGTNKPLYGSKFEGIKRLLSEQNTLPEFLQNARIGGPFRDVSQDNWPSISCDGAKEFANELQMRVYLLDFLLAELKDGGTSLLEECRCFHDLRTKSRGFADYIVKVHGSWVPVETKLKITPASQREVLDQTRQYVRADSFVPTQGAQRGERFEESTSNACLVADQSGIYITSDGEFVGCSPGKPTWQREELDDSIIQTIRDRIREVESRE